MVVSKKNQNELESELPTSLIVIEEFLYLLNTIDKERQIIPKGEWIKHKINQLMTAHGVPSGGEETNILRKWNGEGIIKLKDSNLSGEEYLTYLKPTERFQEYKEVLGKRLKRLNEAKEKKEKQQKVSTSKVQQEYPNLQIAKEGEYKEPRTRVIESPAKYKNGVLKFRGKEINFMNKENQKDLLATLFKNPKKNWSYDEIYEDWDESDFVKNGWRKLYTAGNGINNAVAVETGVKDFIIKNTKQIQISSKYI